MPDPVTARAAAYTALAAALRALGRARAALSAAYVVSPSAHADSAIDSTNAAFLAALRETDEAFAAVLPLAVGDQRAHLEAECSLVHRVDSGALVVSAGHYDELATSIGRLPAGAAS